MKPRLYLLFVLLVASGLLSSFKGVNKNQYIITNRDCVSYLAAKGYSSIVVLQIYQDGSRLCDTSNPYNTTVLVSGDQIVGHVDDGMN